MKKWSIAIPILVLAVAIFLFFAIRGHWDSWKSNATLQKTNDAYVTGDQIPLSTRVSGTVQRVGVQDYQSVKAGQSIVELDNSDYQGTSMRRGPRLAQHMPNSPQTRMQSAPLTRA